MKKKKREKEWTIGIQGPIPPFPFRVWTTKDKSKVMYGFDEQHIRDMMDPVKPAKVKRIPEPKEKEQKYEKLGPPGADVGRPAEYEPAFKILKAWVDSQGGPPEDVRKAIRIHWVDYHRVVKKANKNGKK
jgi:hypothetical protein